LPPTISLSQVDWSLHRKGPIDQARHNEKVKEVIRGDLPGIVGEESIITAEGDKIVKIPIRSLDLPRFRFDDNKRQHVGQGQGDGQGSKVGDVVDGGPAPGQGPGAGQAPGIDYYEAEITVDELAAMVFEDLGLPYLRPNKGEEIGPEALRYDDIRRKGIMSNLDKRRTLAENLRRNAVAGRRGFGGINDGDLRFKVWQPDVKRESNAVVIAMRDVSGSMGEFEKYISRSFYFWMVRFLRTKYDNVRIVFLVHHTEAKEVDEETFFKLGESGGTKVSSAYQLALEIVNERFDPVNWNIYPFHFSDGDNWGETDNQLCLNLVHELLAKANVFGYGEIQQHMRTTPSTLMSAFQELESEERFIGVTIRERAGVYPALREFFSPRESLAALRA
jgi:sporulation protein YhbH